jgi:hypothetical protein
LISSERRGPTKFICQLHRVHDPECIALERQRDFKYAGAQAMQRLGDIRLATLRRDSQCSQADGLGAFGKASEFFSSALIHETVRVFRISAIDYDLYNLCCHI